MLYRLLIISAYHGVMDKRAMPRDRVLKAGTIEFHGGAINCVVRNMTMAGAALDVTTPVGIPEHFNLVFQTEGVHMPCHVVWRKEKRIGVEFE
jgi:PilZ domain-containing protein